MRRKITTSYLKSHKFQYDEIYKVWRLYYPIKGSHESFSFTYDYVNKTLKCVICSNCGWSTRDEYFYNNENDAYRFLKDTI